MPRIRRTRFGAMDTATDTATTSAAVAPGPADDVIRGCRGRDGGQEDQQDLGGQEPDAGREDAHRAEYQNDNPTADLSGGTMVGEPAGQGRIVDHQLLLDRGKPAPVLIAQHRDLPREWHTQPRAVSAHAKPSRGTTPVGRLAPTGRLLLRRPPTLPRARRPPRPVRTRGCRTGGPPRGRSAHGPRRARRPATRAPGFGLHRREPWPRARSTGPRAPTRGSPRPTRPRRPGRSTPHAAARARANGPTTRPRVRRPPGRRATPGVGAPGAAAGR